MEPFKWAFIGAGGIANSVAKRIFHGGRHRLAAVYNRTFVKAERFAEKYGGRAYETMEEAIADENVDGVYINVTNNVHFDLCKKALACGKPVLAEKPFTTDAVQAAELFDIAKENGLYLAEAMWTWFSSPANEVKRIVSEGMLGKIGSGLVTLCLPIAFGKKSRLLKSELAGGALLDLGVYPITYAYRLFGKPNDIVCSAKFKCGVDVSDDIIMKYDGFEVKVMISVRSLRGVGERLKIVGEHGCIESGNYHSGAGAKVKAKSERINIKSDKNAMFAQFDRVAEEMRSGRKESAFVPAQATIEVMELLDEIRGKIGLKFAFEK